MTALYAKVPHVAVVVDRNYAKAQEGDRKRHPTCQLPSYAVNAPNNVTGGVYADANGRVLSGHWVVPPGVHNYTGVINDQDPTFAQADQNMRMAWTHIHPCCTEVLVNRCDGGVKKNMFTAKVKTNTSNGLELTDISLVEPKDGVRFPKGGYYEIEGRYNNTLPVALDSMISVGMYFDDINFRRPDWSMPNSTAAYCGVTSDKSVIVPQSVSASPQLFDPIKDGPLLTKIKQVELDTTMGKLRLFIDPAKAPQTATQFYRLMVEGGFNGVSLINYQPSYLLQVDSVEHNKGKTEGKAKLVVRSLPVEAGSAVSPPARHKKLALSVARQGDDPFSGTSSFCIMLNSAPHLDGKYTVFGWVCDDRESLATLTEITKQWNSRKPVITSCRPI